MSLRYSEIGKEICNRSIFITGNGRSGTTILGKLIHSMQRVDYVFEPPTINALLPLIDSLSDAQFSLIFEAYCVEELLIGQVTGRSANFNKNDDSYIGLVKSEADINERLMTAWSKTKSMSVARQSVLAMKLPSMVPYLGSLRRYYPGMRMIVMHRALNPVIQSILLKKWFADESLAQSITIWPSQTPDFCTPAWVAVEDVDKWRRWSEHDRAAYYYIRMSPAADDADNILTVSYEQLVERPEETVAALADRLGLKFGDRTAELIATTRERSKPTEDWTSRLAPELRHGVEALI